MRTRILLLCLTALMLASATSALASIDEVRLYVEGLACPFCTFGIEKSLSKVPGVASLETTIRTGLVRVQLEPGSPLDPAALNEAIKKSGFTPTKMEVTVSGTLVTRAENPALRSAETGQTFRLVEPGAEGDFDPLSAETLKKLEKASDGRSTRLTVSGQVHSHAGLPPALVVEKFQVAQ